MREGRREQDLHRRAEEDTQRLRGMRATTESDINRAHEDALRRAAAEDDEEQTWCRGVGRKRAGVFIQGKGKRGKL